MRPERRIKPGMDGGLTAASVFSPLHHLRTGKILSKRWGPPHSIGGGIVAGEDRKLLYRIYAEVPPENASRAAIGIIVDADAVEPVIVLLRPRTGNCQLRTKAAISAAVSGCIGSLGFDRHHARLQGRQIGPTSAV